MKTLIYTAAYGELAKSCAMRLVESLRGPGRYDGEITVFSDEPLQFDTAKSVVTNDPLAFKSLLAARWFIGKQIDTAGYDKVLWLDADVCAIRDIAPIWEHGGFGVPIECKVHQELDIPAFSLPCAPCAIGDFGYNSGVVLGYGHGWQLFSQKIWSAIIQHDAWSLPCCDQPVLNHLIRNSGFLVNSFPEEWVHFLLPYRRRITENTMLVHTRKPLKVETMDLLLGLLKSGHPLKLDPVSENKP